VSPRGAQLLVRRVRVPVRGVRVSPRGARLPVRGVRVPVREAPLPACGARLRSAGHGCWVVHEAWLWVRGARLPCQDGRMPVVMLGRIDFTCTEVSSAIASSSPASSASKMRLTMTAGSDFGTSRCAMNGVSV